MTPPFDRHSALQSPHGFFGRRGGVSEGVYDSLNAGQGSDDEPRKVRSNRERIVQALDADALISLAQIHSDTVIIADTAPSERVQADGIVTTIPGLAISALSADCGPLLLEDTKAGVVGACHAGWRGALSGIVESTVATMCEVGAQPDHIRAVLGPCISQPHYEVGQDFMDGFADVDAEYVRFFRPGPSGKPHFDLPGFILSRLEVCGIESRHWTGACTYDDPERYFSYRRNTHQGLKGYGRNISAIMRPH